MGHEFEILTAKRWLCPVVKLRKDILNLAAGFRVEFMHGAGEVIGRQPFRERIALKKGAIDLFWLRGQHPMKTDGMGHSFLP